MKIKTCRRCNTPIDTSPRSVVYCVECQRTIDAAKWDEQQAAELEQIERDKAEYEAHRRNCMQCLVYGGDCARTLRDEPEPESEPQPREDMTIQRGLDVALAAVAKREERHPLGKFSHYTMLYVLRAAAETLTIDISVAEAQFADADPGERPDRNLHHEYEGLVQLLFYPGHIGKEYTAVENVAVLRFLAAVHIALFGDLPACELPGADISFTKGCQACRATSGTITYGCVRQIAQADRDGVLDKAYIPPTPDAIHNSLYHSKLYGPSYRQSLSEGRTPINESASAWLRYNGTVPQWLWPSTEALVPF